MNRLVRVGRQAGRVVRSLSLVVAGLFVVAFGVGGRNAESDGQNQGVLANIKDEFTAYADAPYSQASYYSQADYGWWGGGDGGGDSGDAGGGDA
ncbi:MAG: hypothetical protein HYS26_01110 [Candidatus Kaiserbacteria bacterium]|nr:MAG: hypothetical protein HYS26_01110 [Candidatus Kaiserbacteria bacterium]